MVATAQAWLKDPAATDRYQYDWSDDLAHAGLGTAAIVASSVRAPADLTLADVSRSGAVAAAWIGGGAVGNSYVVTFVLNLSHPSGEGDPIAWERSIRITVADR
jgi:hypothetical protein